MKLLVVSDNHGDEAVLRELAEKYRGKMDAMIHCGDSELPAGNEALSAFTGVEGNCDFNELLPSEKVLTIGENTILIVHGHLHGIKSSLQKVAYKAEELGADFVFFGHSHLLGAEKIGGTIFVNPGSISLPRGGNPKTYALIEKEEDRVSVRFLTENHELAEEAEFRQA